MRLTDARPNWWLGRTRICTVALPSFNFANATLPISVATERQKVLKSYIIDHCQSHFISYLNGQCLILSAPLMATSPSCWTSTVVFCSFSSRLWYSIRIAYSPSSGTNSLVYNFQFIVGLFSFLVQSEINFQKCPPSIWLIFTPRRYSSLSLKKLWLKRACARIRKGCSNMEYTVQRRRAQWLISRVPPSSSLYKNLFEGQREVFQCIDEVRKCRLYTFEQEFSKTFMRRRNIMWIDILH